MSKKNTLIGFEPDVKKRLSLLAANKGLPFKTYCEGVLEMHAYDNKIVEVRDATEDENAPEKLVANNEVKPVEMKEVKYDDLSSDEQEFIDKAVEEFKELKQPEKKSAEKDKKAGKFDRIDSNLFWNGEVYMTRKWSGKKFEEEYFDTEEEARENLKK